MFRDFWIIFVTIAFEIVFVALVVITAPLFSVTPNWELALTRFLIGLPAILIFVVLIVWMAKQIKHFDRCSEHKSDEKHKELLTAIKNNRLPIIYRRSSYGIRKQRKY